MALSVDCIHHRIFHHVTTGKLKCADAHQDSFQDVFLIAQIKSWRRFCSMDPGWVDVKYSISSGRQSGWCLKYNRVRSFYLA